MDNIFIEGIQGMGKSTLLQAIAERRPEYKVCREGEYSPVDLAWCAWMTQEEYRGALERYPDLEGEIRANTFREGGQYILTYTKILTDIPGFHKDLERFEIYSGRVSLEEFRQVVYSRYRRFRGGEYLFECAFFQNILEELILFRQLGDGDIVAFYRRLYETVQKDRFRLLYLFTEDIEGTINAARKDRADEQGNELWYPLMMAYFTESPYGKAHACGSFGDLIAHFRHRQQLELRIIREILGDRAAILPSKRWRTEGRGFVIENIN